MSPRARAILVAGGALNAMLVYAGALGIPQFGARLYAARADQLAGSPSNPISPEGLSLMVMLIVAGLFGWFCMVLAGVAHPWRVELSAVAITIPVTVVVTLLGGLAVALARADQAGSYLWYISNGVGVVFFGAITFYKLGRRHNSRRASSDRNGSE